MTEFDFDELDRSITEAMSKSGLLKNDSQSAEVSTSPVASTPSNISSNPYTVVPASAEPGKLAPGPGPVANAATQPSPAATIGVAKQPSSSATTASVPVSSSAATPDSVRPPVGVTVAQAQAALPTKDTSASVGASVVSQTPTAVQNSTLNTSLVSTPSPTPESLSQAVMPPQVAAIGGTVPVRLGVSKKAKTNRRGRFMDIVSSQPGINKHASKTKHLAVSGPVPDNSAIGTSAASSSLMQRPEETTAGKVINHDSTVAAPSLTSPSIVENTSANIGSKSSKPQSLEPRDPARGSSAFSGNQQPSESSDNNEHDELNDDGDKKRSYSIGGTHGRDITPSAELVESLQKDAQDASNEIGFSQAESRANDIQSIEDASAEGDEDDARVQDLPAPKKRRFMSIGGKPKIVNTAPISPVAEASATNIEGVSEQAEQPTELHTDEVSDSLAQPAMIEPDPPREQTIDEIESGAIYDTSEYYTEFKDDKKHKQSRHSGLKWFLVIIVFLALGALAGAGYFFLTRY